MVNFLERRVVCWRDGGILVEFYIVKIILNFFLIKMVKDIFQILMLVLEKVSESCLNLQRVIKRYNNSGYRRIRGYNMFLKVKGGFVICDF